MSDRLPPISGEWIDRTQILSFTFEGTRYSGFAGDTISSALLASGQRVLGRSFKYHRPRSVLSLANHDVNTLMQSGQALNLRADVTALDAEMSLTAINTLGGVAGDRASVLNFFSAFLPVGFYYKAFLDKKWFPLWERLIRSMTGLGQVDVATPRLRTPKQYDFCDVLVVGAGVSGLSAAIAAADAGANVVIVDENVRAGGTGCYQLGGKIATAERTTELIHTVESHPQIRFYSNTQAAGCYADRWIALVDRVRLTKMRAKAVIVATGAYEQPAVFRNNDLPGVMLTSAAQRLIYRYAVKPMQQAVVLTANQDGYGAALDLAKHGVKIAAVVDLRSAPAMSQTMQTVRSQNIPVYFGSCVYEARSNSAKDGVTAAVICPIDADGKPQLHAPQSIACDGIVMSVGWSPAANLLYQAGTQMQFDQQLQQFVPAQLPDGIFACGRVNGVFAHKTLDGNRAGLEAAEYLGFKVASEKAQETSLQAMRSASEAPSHPYPLIEHPQGKNFVDFDEDLQLKDFFNAAQEGFDNIELLKRYTTVGMGPSQGKHSNMNALRILAKITQKTPEQVGTTTARPFVHPVPLAHLAGRGFHPIRHTPLHSRHTALNAKWMPAGLWQRPEYYQRSNYSREACIAQEALTVRTQVGIIDVGTLGKLEIRGADAAEFLERIYTGRFRKMKVGSTRYALMLDETGVVIDDGVIARLAPDYFYFTTTTSGATAIYREMTRLNTLWQLDCGIVNLTGARSAINLAGPLSRTVLAQLTRLDLSSQSFPYLAVRETEIANIPVIVMRVGFVGEWGYEIHSPAEYAPVLWDALFQVGAAYGMRPFGVAAQRLLRLEKGHIIVGQDTDGLTTPFAVGLEWAVKLDKPFFIGQRSLQALAHRSPQQKLVGFMLDAHFQGIPPQECHLVIAQNQIVGRVTSIAFSPTLQRYIGLAYISLTQTAIGTHFSIRRSDGTLVNAIVCPTPFYDADNLRQQETTASRQEVTV